MWHQNYYILSELFFGQRGFYCKTKKIIKYFSKLFSFFLFFFSFFKKRKENILLNKISQKRVSLELINVFLFVEIGDIYKSPNKISVLNKNINIALKNSILNKKKSQFCLKLTLKILSFFYLSSGKCPGLPGYRSAPGYSINYQ
jgi:hypothetical protein